MGFRAAETVTEGASGDLRYRVEREAAFASAPERRRVIVERRTPTGTWTSAIEVFTSGPAPAKMSPSPVP